RNEEVLPCFTRMRSTASGFSSPRAMSSLTAATALSACSPQCAAPLAPSNTSPTHSEDHTAAIRLALVRIDLLRLRWLRRAEEPGSTGQDSLSWAFSEHKWRANFPHFEHWRGILRRRLSAPSYRAPPGVDAA